MERENSLINQLQALSDEISRLGRIVAEMVNTDGALNDTLSHVLHASWEEANRLGRIAGVKLRRMRAVLASDSPPIDDGWEFLDGRAVADETTYSDDGWSSSTTAEDDGSRPSSSANDGQKVAEHKPGRTIDGSEGDMTVSGFVNERTHGGNDRQGVKPRLSSSKESSNPGLDESPYQQSTDEDDVIDALSECFPPVRDTPSSKARRQELLAKLSSQCPQRHTRPLPLDTGSPRRNQSPERENDERPGEGSGSVSNESGLTDHGSCVDS
ncbi:hypothetical protein VTK56DRAFT_5515 [Thermocarpiscus australiensis]